MNKILKISTLILTMATALQANVSINTTSLQEKAERSSTGEITKSWVKADKIVPGTIIKYVNTLVNSGTQEANKLVIKNPIPKNMRYIANSARCQDACSITYSVDGGNSFASEQELYVGVGENRHIAKASEYTDIKWVVKTLSPNTNSIVEYKAQLK